MKKIILFLILVIFIIPFVSAHCPLCTAAAGVGVGVARFYGVHDSIVGLLLGGFVVSTGLWLNNWLKKRKINIPLQNLILVALSFLLLVVPLYTTSIIHSFDIVRATPQVYSMLGMGIYGIDNLLFGIISGTLLTSVVFGFSDYLKEKNGKRLFVYQGLVFMLISLAIFSFIFWLLT